MSKPISRVWTFTSDSNPATQYETLLYADGSLSCNCPGWTRRLAADGSRSCKHTRAVDMGQADVRCTASHSYQSPNSKPQTNQPHARTQIHESPKLGQRRFAV
jgi:hypothetical protein